MGAGDIGYRESLDGLPEGLLKSLSINKKNHIDQKLIDVIRSFSGIATLDEIIIRMFRQTNEIPDRQYVNNRLLSLVKRNLLKRVPKRKAVYCLPGHKLESGACQTNIVAEEKPAQAEVSSDKQECPTDV